MVKSQSSCADPFDADSLSVTTARERILEVVEPIQANETVLIRDALDRILGERIISPLNVPAHTNSAMDGIACHHDALPPKSETRTLNIVGEAFAGHPYNGVTGKDECVKIMTGAPMPAGTDTVIMQEQLEFLDDKVCIGDGHRAGQNVRQAGEDLAQGSIVFNPGRKITAADLGVLASMGIAAIQVRKKPQVAFFSTGDELVSVGEPLADGDIYDSNRYTLHGMLKKAGVEALDLGVVKDNPDAMRDAFRQAESSADIIITTGGVSVGEADYIKDILAELGETAFWKIAMKPGRPLTFGRVGNSLFFGLPGNPVAVMVTFFQFVFPAIHYLLTGQNFQPQLQLARSNFDFRKKPGRTEYVRGLFKPTDVGHYEVDIISRQGSGILTSMSRSNCFVVLPEEHGDVKIGDEVMIQPFSDFL